MDEAKDSRKFFLIDRKPQELSKGTAGKNGLILQGPDGRVLDNGVIVMNDSVRAVLYCEEVKNITFLVKQAGKYAVETLIFGRREEFRTLLDQIRNRYPGTEISRQNRKINRYAERIREKLNDGAEVRIVDAVREEDVVICPECGAQCAPGTPYCMECGAEL